MDDYNRDNAALTDPTMTYVLAILLALFAASLLAIAAGILRLHASMGPHHLRGRYTWTEELAAREAEWMKD